MAQKECFKCKTKHDTKEMTQVLKHWICPNCYDKYITSTAYYKEKFIDDVWKLYDKKPQFNQLTAQVEELNKRYGFSYRGMSVALECYLIEHEWNQKYLLYQAFPNAYYDAITIYARQEALRNSMPSVFNVDEQVATTRTISYKPPLRL